VRHEVEEFLEEKGMSCKRPSRKEVRLGVNFFFNVPASAKKSHPHFKNSREWRGEGRRYFQGETAKEGGIKAIGHPN